MKMFTCELCQGTFREVSTDEQTRSEYENTWGRPWRSEDVASLCDDCYKFALARIARAGLNPGGRA
ncbi:hypothetical protein ELH77_19095 [Rhizobium ruizarguesonis]|uniref:hypothetical protein n=1 Tax=Rhizobium ruizarguesonis TaxID=2081791 RepID=UPI001030A254|nr:hypothetical protein [Rhizobium ruizarguesonis]TAZ20713.1 hypothetical protein ELH77_19095 [Rhizobium ruizarguesonis]